MSIESFGFCRCSLGTLYPCFSLGVTQKCYVDDVSLYFFSNDASFQFRKCCFLSLYSPVTLSINFFYFTALHIEQISNFSVLDLQQSSTARRIMPSASPASTRGGSKGEW